MPPIASRSAGRHLSQGGAAAGGAGGGDCRAEARDHEGVDRKNVELVNTRPYQKCWNISHTSPHTCTATDRSAGTSGWSSARGWPRGARASSGASRRRWATQTLGTTADLSSLRSCRGGMSVCFPGKVPLGHDATSHCSTALTLLSEDQSLNLVPSSVSDHFPRENSPPHSHTCRISTHLTGKPTGSSTLR